MRASPHHTVGSSTRIGVRRVAIGAPTVRLAEIVGAGCEALAAAAAITMRLRGRAAASARPPPAVRAKHLSLLFKMCTRSTRSTVTQWDAMAGTEEPGPACRVGDFTSKVL